jgi:hypothetical protein
VAKPNLFGQSNIQPKDWIMRNLKRLNLVFAVVLLAAAMTSSAGTLIDVDFTTASVTSKTGFAATGVTANDFWNTCTATTTFTPIGFGSAGVVPNLKFVNGTASGAGLAVDYSGQWFSVHNNGASDPMYATYFDELYGSITVTVTNLVAGAYDVYLYGHGNFDGYNSIYQLTVASQSYGSEATTSGSGWLSPVWQEGVQYVEFTNVSVSVGQTITITVENGTWTDSVIAGLQIASSPSAFIFTQPTTQVVAPGATATFSVVAGGVMPLAYQWLSSNVTISDATNSSYSVTNAQLANVGSYSVIVTNAYGSITSESVALNVITPVTQVIDVAFTSAPVTSKAGFAATGVSSNDFWNTCTTNGVADLEFADGTASGAGMNISGVETSYENGALDPMFGTYFYTEVPNISSGIVVTITNLPAGGYVFYIYGHGNEDNENSVFEISVGLQTYGSQATDGADAAWLSSVWQEGIQYVKLHANVSAPGQITITTSPGSSPYAFISGIQIVPAPAPYIFTEPASQFVAPSAIASFNVLAFGATPLFYQWQCNGTNISEATNSTYIVTNVQPANQGDYFVIVTNAYGSITSTVASLVVDSRVPPFIDAAFTDASATSKTGFAATGETAYDFWNTCTTNGAANLKFVDGAPSGAGVTITGIESTYENGAADPMFGTYFYTEVPNFSSGIMVAITNLSADLYDFYIYGHGNENDENSVFQVAVGSQSYGSQATDGGDAAWLSPLWQEGIQYVEFTKVSVLAGQVVTITASPGASPYSFISGMQMVPFVLPTNGSPLIINTPNQFVNATQGVIVTNYAFSPEEPISFSLASNAPAGATITAEGVFDWVPTCEQGSTTNLITVWATDSSSPPLSNSMTFSVIVGECVEVSIGSSVVQAGQSTCVPVNLVASVGLTNLSFSLAYPSGFLTNWNITPSNSLVTSATAQTVDASHTQFNFGVQSGQVLHGSTVLGSICLDTLPGASAFVPLAVANMGATASNNSPVTNLFGQMGRIVVIGNQSWLEGSLGTNSSRTLTLYGTPGVSYDVLSTTNLADNSSWMSMGNVTLTDLFQVISLDGATNQMQFFKAVQP